MKRLLFALALVCLPSLCQDRYTVTVKANLSGASRTVTIAQPGSGAKRIEIEQISVQPFAAGGITVQLERDCTSYATTTAVARVPVNSDSAPTVGAKFLAYDASTATGCTVLAPDWIVPDGGLLPVPSLGTFKEGSGGTKNINVRIAPLFGTALTGVIRLQVIVRESR